MARLAGLGAAVGLCEAVLGLLLGAGRSRFALAAAIVGVLLWLASRSSERPAIVEVVRLSGRAGALILAGACGAALGMWIGGRASADAAPLVWPGSMMLLLALAAGVVAATAGEERGRSHTVRLVALAVGAAAGVALGQVFVWGTARAALWGAGSGGALALAATRLAGGRSERGALFLIVSLLVFDAALPHAWNDTGGSNLYTHQAIAFLRGRLDVEPIQLLDVSWFEGRKYLPFPPFPAIVLMPFVGVQGDGAPPHLPMSLISACLAGLSAVLLCDVLRMVGIDRGRRYWTTAALVFGTGLLTVSVATDALASYFALAVSVPCLLLAIREALGSARGLLVGLFLGMAFLSRPVTGLASAFLVVVLWERGEGGSVRARWLNCAGFVAGAALCGAASLAFNQLRFGTPFEMGFTHVNVGGYILPRLRQYGAFSVIYVPFNLYHLFLHGFSLRFARPTFVTPVVMDRFGTSLTVASPFAFLALWSRWTRPRAVAAWASILAMLAVHLLYHNQGTTQTNTQRYTLDYFPILIILVALGAQRVRPAIYEGLVAYAIALNLIAVIFQPRLWW